MDQRRLAFLNGLQDGMEKFAIGQAQIARIQEAVGRMSSKDIIAAGKRNIDPAGTKSLLRAMRPGGTAREMVERGLPGRNMGRQRPPPGASSDAPTYETLQRFIPGPAMVFQDWAPDRLNSSELKRLRASRGDDLATLSGREGYSGSSGDLASLQARLAWIKKKMAAGGRGKLPHLMGRLQQRIQVMKQPAPAPAPAPGGQAPGMRKLPPITRTDKKKEVQRNIADRYRVQGLRGDLDVADKTLASGRHRPTDVVTLPQVTPDTVAKQVGVAPKQVMYKGGLPGGDTDPTTPLWFSGSPSIAGGYAQKRPGGTLRAYQTHPNARWSPHVATDTFNLSQDQFAKLKAHATKKGGGRLAGRSSIGGWKNYETVAPGGVVGEPLAEYKPMATPDKFMMTRGVLNPLGGDLE